MRNEPTLLFQLTARMGYFAKLGTATNHCLRESRLVSLAAHKPVADSRSLARPLNIKIGLFPLCLQPHIVLRNISYHGKFSFVTVEAFFAHSDI